MSVPAEFTHAYATGHDRGHALVERYGALWAPQWQVTVGSTWATVAQGLWSAEHARRFLTGLWHGVIDARDNDAGAIAPWRRHASINDIRKVEIHERRNRT